MSILPTPISEELYHYILSVSLREPEFCRELRLEAAGDKFYNMQIGPDQGQFLALLAQLICAKHCLEIGTYMGYSSLWLALHLPADGTLIACDISTEWLPIARRYWEKAKLAHKIEFRAGPALKSLEDMLENKSNQNSLDLVFIDADKNNYINYYEACLRLVRPGGLIAFDNTLWGGDVARPQVKDPSLEGIRALNSLLSQDQRIDLSLVPIGDGLSLARKR